jgi:hypothetical protein
MNESPTAALLNPLRLYSRAEILVRPCPVPKQAGVYAWYFRETPPKVPTHDCLKARGATLLYVGIAPKKPPGNGALPSRQRLINRVRYHLRGNAAGSTLRLTLGCLLAEMLGIELRRVGSGNRYTFADGEVRLSEWMHENALVAWLPAESPWELEHQLIRQLSLPLNLAGNEAHPFYTRLSELRRASKLKAVQLPIM